MLKGLEDLYAAKGKKVVHIDLRKGLPSDEELSGLLLGPTGNLRAPIVRSGKKLVVGFEQQLYEQVLG